MEVIWMNTQNREIDFYYITKGAIEIQFEALFTNQNEKDNSKIIVMNANEYIDPYSLKQKQQSLNMNIVAIRAIKKDTRVSRIQRKTYDLFCSQINHEKWIKKSLEGVLCKAFPLLEQKTQNQKDQLTSYFRLEVYEPNQLILEENQSKYFFNLIFQGSVKVYKKFDINYKKTDVISPNSKKIYEQKVSSKILNGDYGQLIKQIFTSQENPFWLGEEEIILNEPNNFTYITDNRVVLLQADSIDFFEKLDEDYKEEFIEKSKQKLQLLKNQLKVILNGLNQQALVEKDREQIQQLKEKALEHLKGEYPFARRYTYQTLIKISEQENSGNFKVVPAQPANRCLRKGQPKFKPVTGLFTEKEIMNLQKLKNQLFKPIQSTTNSAQKRKTSQDPSNVNRLYPNYNREDLQEPLSYLNIQKSSEFREFSWEAKRGSPKKNVFHEGLFNNYKLKFEEKKRREEQRDMAFQEEKEKQVSLPIQSKFFKAQKSNFDQSQQQIMQSYLDYLSEKTRVEVMSNQQTSENQASRDQKVNMRHFSMKQRVKRLDSFLDQTLINDAINSPGSSMNMGHKKLVLSPIRFDQFDTDRLRSARNFLNLDKTRRMPQASLMSFRNSKSGRGQVLNLKP